MQPWLIVVLALALIAFAILLTYNRVVKARNMVDESWSGVDIQLKRRRDLVPNLVSCVQRYAAHEQQTLQALTESRAAAEGASHAGPGSAAPAENWLTDSLRRMFVVVERYPNLKADANFMQLQGELIRLENNVAGARSIYNSNVRSYNDKIQSFPVNLFAATLGFRPRPYVEAAARERSVTEVGF